ncbi:hypothetical protein [Streptococcus suis]|uniref:Uncharacterized protein n=1 Tax=Streptococcus suis TaxID=1307 RepID=A0A0F6UXJ7_STRSU|nr:hypothetical protein [Streptococcus suis]AKE80216.1 hypothetical protein YS46.seq-orf00028 [Streptococcus suis]
MYSKYEIAHVACDRKQDVKTVYNEYKANKQQFINKIANCVKDDGLKTYFNRIVHDYDEKMYIDSVERVLKNRELIFQNKDRILKTLKFYDKRNRSDCEFLNENNVEVYLNSLHVNNDRLAFYLKQLNDDYNDAYESVKISTTSGDLQFDLPHQLKGANHDKGYQIDFVVQTKS